MMIGMVSQIVCGNVTGLVTIFELHMLFRTFSAICCGLMYTAGGMICNLNICYLKCFFNIDSTNEQFFFAKNLDSSK